MKSETTRRCVHGRTERQVCRKCNEENRMDHLRGEIIELKARLRRVNRPGLRLKLGDDILRAERELRAMENV
jgi:hypothetical protein